MLGIKLVPYGLRTILGGYDTDVPLFTVQLSTGLGTRLRTLDVFGSLERGLRLRAPSKGRYRLALVEIVEMRLRKG